MRWAMRRAIPRTKFWRRIYLRRTRHDSHPIIINTI